MEENPTPAVALITDFLGDKQRAAGDRRRMARASGAGMGTRRVGVAREDIAVCRSVASGRRDDE
jgi:hypothetical protein